MRRLWIGFALVCGISSASDYPQFRLNFIQMRTFALSALLLLSSVSGYAENKLIGGPLAVNVDDRSAVVVWIVEEAELRLGTYDGVPSRIAPALRAERVGFTGLEAGKKYYYEIPGQPESKGYFRTAPKKEGAAYEFVVFGDTRTRHELHQQIVDAILATTDPDFVLHTGDLVSNGIDTGQWPVFFNIEKELLNKTVYFPVLGNHERNSRHFYEFFDVKTPYYSFDWGEVHFTILNSDLGNVATSEEAKERFWAEQLRWLEEDLEDSQKAPLRFVTMHHPPFTAVKRRQGGNKPVMDMVPLFEKYNVSAVFTGHDHNYQHHVKDGIHYVVTGGGGAPLYPVDGPLEGITQKVESTEHFVRVKVDGAQAVVEAVALDGHVIDIIEFGQ